MTWAAPNAGTFEVPVVLRITILRKDYHSIWTVASILEGVFNADWMEILDLYTGPEFKWLAYPSQGRA